MPVLTFPALKLKEVYDSRAFALKLLGQKRTQCHAQCLKWIPLFILHMSLRSRTCLSKFFTSVHRIEEIDSLAAFICVVVTNICTGCVQSPGGPAGLSLMVWRTWSLKKQWCMGWQGKGRCHCGVWSSLWMCSHVTGWGTGNILSANDDWWTALGVQRQQVNSRGAGGTLYSSGSMCCSSSYVFLWIEEQIFYKVESSWVLFFGFLVWLVFFFVKQSRADSV